MLTRIYTRLYLVGWEEDRMRTSGDRMDLLGCDPLTPLCSMDVGLSVHPVRALQERHEGRPGAGHPELQQQTVQAEEAAAEMPGDAQGLGTHQARTRSGGIRAE